MSAAGRPSGTVAGRVAGRLPTGVAVAPGARPELPTQPAGRAAPLVIDLTVTPATTTPVEAPAVIHPAPGTAAGSRVAALAVLLVGLVAVACLLLLDLGTVTRALAGLVALWGVVVGGFALARPATSST